MWHNSDIIYYERFWLAVLLIGIGGFSRPALCCMNRKTSCERAYFRSTLCTEYMQSLPSYSGAAVYRGPRYMSRTEADSDWERAESRSRRSQYSQLTAVLMVVVVWSVVSRSAVINFPADHRATDGRTGYHLRRRHVLPCLPTTQLLYLQESTRSPIAGFTNHKGN